MLPPVGTGLVSLLHGARGLTSASTSSSASARAEIAHRLRLPLPRPLPAREPRRPRCPLRLRPALLHRRSSGALTTLPRRSGPLDQVVRGVGTRSALGCAPHRQVRRRSPSSAADVEQALDVPWSQPLARLPNAAAGTRRPERRAARRLRASRPAGICAECLGPPPIAPRASAPWSGTSCSRPAPMSVMMSPAPTSDSTGAGFWKGQGGSPCPRAPFPLACVGATLRISRRFSVASRAPW